ncbi:MAG: class I SAM-dependent methyltransferase [Bacteroidia bacterium]
MQDEKHPDWFACWFDTPYYHLLYRNRDHSEAEKFMDNVLALLHPEKKARILDLACGKGRHSIYLAQKGFDVTGIDLSKHSIECAQQSENDHLHFYVHDMRKLFRTNYFDLVLNLFTSFGYFENERDNNAVIHAAVKALKPGGTFVLDFMNSTKVIADLKPEYRVSIEGIDFTIHKRLEKNIIVKEIEFRDKGKDHRYTEKVSAFTMSELEVMFVQNGLKIVDLRGSYQLEEFDAASSDRAILIGRKE